MHSWDLLRDAGELAGRADAAGVSHAGVGLVRLDVDASTAATAVVHIIGVSVLGLVWGVGGGGLVRVGGTGAAAGRGAGTVAVIWSMGARKGYVAG